MKRGIIVALLGAVLFIDLASASSLSDFLYSFDPQTVFIMVSFLICFAILNFSLTKMFKTQKSTGTVVALGISLLIVYGINRLNFDLENLYYSIFPDDFITTVIPLVLIAGIGFLIWKIKWHTLWVIGSILIFIDLLGITARERTLSTIGIALIIGYIVSFFIRRKPQRNAYTGNIEPHKTSRRYGKGFI